MKKMCVSTTAVTTLRAKQYGGKIYLFWKSVLLKFLLEIYSIEQHNGKSNNFSAAILKYFWEKSVLVIAL